MMDTREIPSSVVVDTSASRYARLRPVPVGDVALNDRFWAPRLAVNRAATLPAQHRYLEETGRLDNFRRAAGAKDVPFQGIYFNDSDVYKWLEAVAWALAAAPDPALERLADAVIAEVGAAQQEDGYLNTYFMFERAAERWTNFDLHEMYCAGHLFQAAVAHYRATGKTSLLAIATRFADYLDRTFGPEEQGKRVYADGHEEVEMALVELARATGEQRYRDLAQFFVDARGYGRLKHERARFDSAYFQDHRPFRELSEMVGHAVRAVYYNAGAADLYAERGEPALRAALDRLWQNMTTRRMYVSGGIGSRYEGESFGVDYELPNGRAYTETCAAIGSVMWSWRMLALQGEARYADLIEWTLYNAVLPGLGLDGETYFYQNPLADDGRHRREPWFGCACCPPNVARMLASLPGYLYSRDDDGGIWVHLYAESTTRIAGRDGETVTLTQRTAYPWDGAIVIEVAGAGEWSLRLRIPGWCGSGAALLVNGDAWEAELTPGGYAEVRRAWSPGDRVELRLPMPVRRLEAHPYVVEDAGRVALARGPLLYCAEEADNPGVDLRDLLLPPGVALTPVAHPELLGGIMTLEGSAELAPPEAAWDGRLYRDAPAAESPRRFVPLTAVPYYAWANRAPGQMLVWLRAG